MCEVKTLPPDNSPDEHCPFSISEKSTLLLYMSPRAALRSDAWLVNICFDGNAKYCAYQRRISEYWNANEQLSQPY